MADVALGIDQVVGGPVLVLVGVPGLVVVVDGHRVLDAETGRLALHVGYHVLEVELRGAHPDDHQAVLGVVAVPGFDVGQGALAVDTGVGPEVHQDHLAPQLGQAERLAAGRVQPADDPGEVRGRAAVDQSGGRRAAVGQIGGAGWGRLVFTFDAGELLADLVSGLAHGGVARKVLL